MLCVQHSRDEQMETSANAVGQDVVVIGLTVHVRPSQIARICRLEHLSSACVWHIYAWEKQAKIELVFVVHCQFSILLCTMWMFVPGCCALFMNFFIPCPSPIC